MYSEKLNRLGFIEADPKPSSDELGKFYSEKYWQNSQKELSPSYTPDEIKSFYNVAKVAEETIKQLDLEKSLLDLGCGQGFFAKSFYLFNWKVACCDFSDFGINEYNKDMKPYFVSGDIYELIKSFSRMNRKYGLINLQGVLEHVVDPIDLLNIIKPLFSKKSVLRVSVPNDYSDFQKALLNNNFTKNTWFTPPEHLSFFNKSGLENILEYCGYRLYSLQADFPIEIFLANEHSNYWKNRELGKQAHLARVFCQNYLIEKDILTYIKYAELAAKLDFGRQLIAYAVLI